MKNILKLCRHQPLLLFTNMSAPLTNDLNLTQPFLGEVSVATPVIIILWLRDMTELLHPTPELLLIITLMIASLPHLACSNISNLNHNYIKLLWFSFWSSVEIVSWWCKLCLKVPILLQSCATSQHSAQGQLQDIIKGLNLNLIGLNSTGATCCWHLIITSL